MVYRLENSSFTCWLISNQYDVQLQANSPANPGGGSDVIFDSSNDTEVSLQCFAIPPYNTSSELILEFWLNWNSLDSVVNNTFFTVPKQQILSDEPFTIEPGYNYFHYANSTPDGALVFLDFANDSGCTNAQIWIASDDWLLGWFLYAGTPLIMTSFYQGYGWLIAAWTAESCQGTIHAIPTTTIVCASATTNSTVHLAEVNGTYMGFIHITTPTKVTGVQLDFTQNLLSIEAQAAKAPVVQISNYDVIFQSDTVS
jgi:hypothetical protein